MYYDVLVYELLYVWFAKETGESQFPIHFCTKLLFASFLQTPCCVEKKPFQILYYKLSNSLLASNLRALPLSDKTRYAVVGNCVLTKGRSHLRKEYSVKEGSIYNAPWLFMVVHASYRLMAKITWCIHIPTNGDAL